MNTIQLHSTPTDDPAFLEKAEAALQALIAKQKPEALYVIHIKNWFDHKWLNFSGKALGMLGVHKFEGETVVPPFVPGRILNQSFFTGSKLAEAGASQLHVSLPSSANLRRRIEQVAPGASFFWYSSNSLPNARGSVMAYWQEQGELKKYFLGLAKNPAWKVQASKGMPLDSVSALLRAGAE